MSLPGAVHIRTGNVPLQLGGGYLLHFEGRGEVDTFVARLGRFASVGPAVPFSSLSELIAYLEDMIELAPAVRTEGVDSWLETRLAEPLRS